MDSGNAFEPAMVGGIEAKNRIIRSATYEGSADKGSVSDTIMAMHRSLCEGGVGTIITGYICVSKTDNPGPKTVSAMDDGCVPGLKAWADAVHASGTKIVAQLNHATSQIFFPPNSPVYGPSAVTDFLTGITPTPFTTEQVRELVKEFGGAALRLKNAGFDGVQIHAAHGYLVHRFLSPMFNQRDDEYGGSPENNRRLMMEILAEIKFRCGSDFPVWIKLNCSDFDAEGKGMTPDMFLETGEVLARGGIDAIEVSGGTMFGTYYPSRSKKHTAYHLDYAGQLMEKTDVPVILVGGLRSIDLIEKILEETPVTAVALSRALIREPGLIKRWMGGDRSDAACVACNGCFNPKGTRCFFDLTDKEKEFQKAIMKMMAPK